MKNLIQAAVVTLLAASAAQAQQAVQWKVSDGGNGHWYKLHSVPSPWILARQVALSPGGDLCSLETDTERGWIALTISCALAYVGGYQLPGATTPSDRWTWLTGAPVSLPLDCDNNPCIAGTAAEDGEQDYLHSAGCWTVYGDVNIVAYGDCSIPDWGLAVFEWDADCSYDGVVDYGQCHDGARPDYDGNNIPDCCERGEACTVGSYPVQWCVEDGGNGHWYDQRIWTGPKSIVDINVSYVAQVGAHAVTITSPSENEFVYRAVHSRTLGATHDGYSILGGYQDPGASDYLEPAGGWRWVTGEPMTYMNWGRACRTIAAAGKACCRTRMSPTGMMQRQRAFPRDTAIALSSNGTPTATRTASLTGARFSLVSWPMSTPTASRMSASSSYVATQISSAISTSTVLTSVFCFPSGGRIRNSLFPTSTRKDS